jgi:putative ABC transport system permease protein
MNTLAWRNLSHDRVRLAVTLTGIVFAIVLIVVQLGLFIGFTTTTSSLIDRSGADLWIAARGLQNVDTPAVFSERKLYHVLGTPGVAHADRFIVWFSNWKRPDGGQESVEVVGFNPDTWLGGPWNVVAGDPRDLKAENTVFIDEFYKDKLGVTHLGQMVEINGYRARVAGFTRGIRSFTTSPHVFTWFKNAQNYAALRADQLNYILVKASPGVDIPDLQRRLGERVKDVEVLTTSEISRKTQNYWMFTTGAGVAILIAAAMGLVVGVVVVAQTIYATTMDHIREFGTLKAMGASNGYIYRVIVRQAVFSAVAGYVMSMGISLMVVRNSARGGATILMPWELALGMLGLSVVMCVAASLVSINKVTRIDPAMVFKG